MFEDRFRENIQGNAGLIDSAEFVQKQLYLRFFSGE